MNYYSEIKRELINNEVNNKVKDYSKNKYELETYLRVGKLLIDAQGGEAKTKIIKKYARDEKDIQLEHLKTCVGFIYSKKGRHCLPNWVGVIIVNYYN